MPDMSMEDKRQAIYMAFDMMVNPSMMNDMPIMSPHIEETYNNYVIVCMGMDEYYKVGYSTDADGKIAFDPRDQWKPVTEKWAAKATVKAISENDDEYILEILGAPYGGPINGRDEQGERFTSASNLHTDDFPEIPLVLAHGLDPHTGEPVGKPVYVGKAKYLRSDARGHWWKGVLDKTKAVVEGLWKAAKKGRLGASSGSLAHLVRIARDGTILEWPVAEMTLADLDSNVHPINSYAIAAPMMKATYREAGLPFPAIRDNLPEALKAAKRAKVKEVQNRSKILLNKLGVNQK